MKKKRKYYPRPKENRNAEVSAKEETKVQVPGKGNGPKGPFEKKGRVCVASAEKISFRQTA